MSQAIQQGEFSRPAAGNLAKQAWALLPGRAQAFATLAVAIGLAGLGHGALALAAGLLGRSLVGGLNGAAAGGLSVRNIAYFGLGAACVKATGSILLAFSESTVAGRVAMALRRQLTRGLSRSGLPRARLSVFATIAVRSREVETAVAQGVIGGARAVAQLAPILLGLIFVSPSLALVGSAVLVPFGLGIAALRRRWRRSSEQAQRLAEEIHAGVDELLTNLDLWRTFGATERIERSIERSNAQAVRQSARVDAARAALSSGNEVLAALALVGAISMAAHFGHAFDDGTVVSFAAMCFMAYRPLRDLGDSRAWLARGNAALDALHAIVRVERASSQDEPAPRGASFEPARLVAVELGARDRGPCVDLDVAAGAVLAVVGPTGSGKTTLLRVLLGLEPARGELDFGAERLTHRPVGPEHRPFAWVPQDAALVTGTILENVALLCGDESRARIALAELGATRLLGRSADLVGPGGRPLSGGERRLVSIARALAPGLPVLLLDEPTEGLDAASRDRVIDALRRLGGRRTLIIATHQPELVALADRSVELGAPLQAPLAAE